MAEDRMQAKEPDINQLRKVRRDKLKDLQAEGHDPFRITVYDQEHHTEEAKALFLAEEAKEVPGTVNVKIAGRLMQKRVMGKASFCNVQDRDGNIQVYATRDMLGGALRRLQEAGRWRYRWRVGRDVPHRKG